MINWWLLKKRRSNAAPVNLVVNPSVELGTTEPTAWFYSANTEWSTGDAYDGDRSLRINVTNGTADWRTAIFPVVGGKTYRVGVWVKGAGNVVTVLALRWFSDTDGQDYVDEQWIVLDQNYTDWRQIDEHVTVPANAQSADLMFRAAFNTTVDVRGDLFFAQPDDFTHSLQLDSMHNSSYLGWL